MTLMQEYVYNFRSQCRTVLIECNDGYAKAYAHAGLAMDDVKEIRVQALYIVSNLSSWRHPYAKTVRAELKAIGKGYKS